MKINKLSILGGVAGIVIVVSSIIQWFFLFHDPSQLALGVSIGLIVCGFAYIYNWMREGDIQREKLNKRLDTFTDWWTKQEMK